jgi:HEAT repeat protein
LLILFLLLIAFPAWWIFFHREPVYRGKPVRAWVQELKNTQNTEKNETFHVLLDIGPDCLPALVEELRPMDNIFTRTYAGLWPRLPRSLARFFPQPKPSRAERRATAAWALGQIGPAARRTAPALVKALDDPDDRVRTEAALALRWVGAKDQSVISALGRRLNDPAPMVRSRAAEALWDMAPESQAALASLTQLLYDPDLAYHGALCLEKLGPLASNSIPPLIEVVKRGVAGNPPKRKFSPPLANQEDPSAHNRAMAAKTLGAIGVPSEEVLAALKTALTYPKPWVRQNAAKALGQFGTNGLSALGALALTLDDTNPPVAQEAALSLGAMRGTARPALPALTNLLAQLPEPFTSRIGENNKWPVFWLRNAVGRAIVQIDPGNKPAIEVLLENVEGDYNARRVLAENKAAKAEVVARLEKSLIATNGRPRIGSTELLWHLDPKHPDVVPTLRRALEDTNSATRAFAAYWYWEVTRDADPSLKILIAGLEEPASGASQSFPQWMEKMGPAARPAVPALKRALWHHDVFARRNAAKALEKISPSAESRRTLSH